MPTIDTAAAAKYPGAYNVVWTRDEIVETVRALPDPLRGYCSWIFVGACDIVETLAGKQDFVTMISELYPPVANTARQTALCLTAASAFRQKALAFERKYGDLDFIEEFSVPLAEEIGADSDQSLGGLLEAVHSIIADLVIENANDLVEEMLEDKLNVAAVPEDKKARHMRVYDSLEQLIGDFYTY